MQRALFCKKSFHTLYDAQGSQVCCVGLFTSIWLMVFLSETSFAQLVLERYASCAHKSALTNLFILLCISRALTSLVQHLYKPFDSIKNLDWSKICLFYQIRLSNIILIHRRSHPFNIVCICSALESTNLYETFSWIIFNS